jgi:hypothetical protein
MWANHAWEIASWTHSLHSPVFKFLVWTEFDVLGEELPCFCFVLLRFFFYNFISQSLPLCKKQLLQYVILKLFTLVVHYCYYCYSCYYAELSTLLISLNPALYKPTPQEQRVNHHSEKTVHFNELVVYESPSLPGDSTFLFVRNPLTYQTYWTG